MADKRKAFRCDQAGDVGAPRLSLLDHWRTSVSHRTVSRARTLAPCGPARPPRLDERVRRRFGGIASFERLPTNTFMNLTGDLCVTAQGDKPETKEEKMYIRKAIFVAAGASVLASPAAASDLPVAPYATGPTYERETHTYEHRTAPRARCSGAGDSHRSEAGHSRAAPSGGGRISCLCSTRSVCRPSRVCVCGSELASRMGPSALSRRMVEHFIGRCRLQRLNSCRSRSTAVSCNLRSWVDAVSALLSP